METDCTLTRDKHGRCFVDLGIEAFALLAVAEGDHVTVTIDGRDILGIVGAHRASKKPAGRLRRVWLTCSELDIDAVESVVVRRVRRV